MLLDKLDKMENINKKNIVIMGDFNSYKREDYDEENYQRLTTLKKSISPDMNIFRAIEYMEQNGYIDTYQTRANDLGVSLQDIIPINTTDKGGRIDFIFIKQGSDIKINNIYTYYTSVSDHIPIIADISISN